MSGSCVARENGSLYCCEKRISKSTCVGEAKFVASFNTPLGDVVGSNCLETLPILHAFSWFRKQAGFLSNGPIFSLILLRLVLALAPPVPFLDFPAFFAFIHPILSPFPQARLLPFVLPFGLSLHVPYGPAPSSGFCGACLSRGISPTVSVILPHPIPSAGQVVPWGVWKAVLPVCPGIKYLSRGGSRCPL